ncbi:[Fe-Fe] hydrogenase large subunit C-terminal domain-containing protein [Sporohalobacter salinus]|uniref:[Fe-Fe] hydrogenase large subunit C-terminal domain-containing protein n=1 Tax=Sporohalobacter salinus TaxID=1494606 RepID=UPI0019603FF1|nr:[Fe-Fe] hydrogenase large subunit C-terminal domain-containing protein [Sporohalobacter salinus]MBM7624569.1 iron only hydrogenase large subunit-like protein [Sporohalobacter salinus]
MEIIKLSESDCKDCYRCLRNCELKAIGIKNNQAEVIEEKCIKCGKCIEICPQNAKEVTNHLTQLKEKLQQKKLVASVAPSFIAEFDFSPHKLVTALKKLGFYAVEETAQGAKIIADYYQQSISDRSQPIISACCPAVVSLIEKHYPELISYLSNSVSPMVAHGRLIKEKYSDVEVVFIGPCIAKLEEITWDSIQEAIDLAITFDQLQELFDDQQLIPEELPESQFDDLSVNWSTAFPVEKGVLQAAGIDNEFNTDIITVSGVKNCIDTFEDLLAGEINPQFIEALICVGGCINGPGISSDLGLHARREKVVNYSRNLVNKRSTSNKQENINIGLTRYYTNQQIEEEMPTENQINSILSQLGKFSSEDELDCGGCGYDTCRDKAVAVYQGQAEEKMCIPYMKGKMETLTDIIVKSSPNAIIVVDKDMVIQKFNPRANKLFNRNRKSPIGNKLDKYVDPSDFVKVWETGKNIAKKKMEYEQYGVVVEKAIFSVPEYELVIGILADITERERHKEKMANMKEKTLKRANAVINKQMKVAQEIAGLLGESTSETKAILHEVRELMQEEDR